MNVWLFKLIGLVITLMFIRYGLLMRQPKKSIHLSKRWTLLLMKFSASFLVGLFLVALSQLTQVLWWDWTLLGLMGVGAMIVAVAQRKLNASGAFTWTGYALKTPKLVTGGIYSKVRHPLYLGVYCVEIGAAGVILFRFEKLFSEWGGPLFVLTSVCLLFAMTFNAVLASRESQYLQEVFGPEYITYKKAVPAVLPKWWP
ncbi:MAG: hypothetical protein KDD61_11645 [Bdellovibrionales bacterium]|nr:hypothetical protein [Bdellovibrionales bacterium]